ncbi:hypothetical protein SASPL_148505 [Salvia splendens]|uniref:hAT-like transposase RNase-H fold domain-containing protein n=1 Tax=Salvia splendens TaxID=180675 RepID=A0A8X8W9V0_SALSN|nr:hypothetical protein SASPL_148505 [Salvia splendens]
MWTAESQSGRSPNCPNISQSPLNTQQDSNDVLNDQDLEDASILKDIEEEDVDVDVSQSRSKNRKTEKKKEPRSIHWKDYIRVKVMSGDPPTEILKGKCKCCDTLIAADPRCHKATDIGESIITTLKDWGLTSLFCCTMDNAYANDGAIGDVKSYLNKFNMRRVREAVKWLTSSPQRILQLAKVVNILADRIDCKKALCLDVPTRWNSTYLLLQSAIPYEEAFQLYSQMYPSYKKDLSQKKHNDDFIGLLEGQDWINVNKMIEYLQKFYELTVSDDEIGKYWAEDMELNPRMNMILYIAAVLDPRQKMNHVETCFKSIYGDARGEILVRDITYALNELFDYYVAQKEARNPAQHRKDAANENMRSQGRFDRRGSLSLVGLRDSDP